MVDAARASATSFTVSGLTAVAVHALVHRLSAGSIEQVPRVAQGQLHDTPQIALAHPTLDGEQHLSQPAGLRADGAGLLQAGVGWLAQGSAGPLS